MNLCKCGCGTVVSGNYKRGHCNRGRKFGALSVETKEKLRQANLGKHVSEKTKLLMSENNMNKKEIRWVINDTGCWNCISHMTKNKYPKINRNGKVLSIARFMFEKKFGVTPKELFVCHKCDNPSCINPEHLFLGTIQENKQDEVNKGRQAKGETDGNHKLTEEQVLEIRNSNKIQKNIAKRFGINRNTVYKITNRKLWKHI